MSTTTTTTTMLSETISCRNGRKEIAHFLTKKRSLHGALLALCLLAALAVDCSSAAEVAAASSSASSSSLSSAATVGTAGAVAGAGAASAVTAGAVSGAATTAAGASAAAAAGIHQQQAPTLAGRVSQKQAKWEQQQELRRRQEEADQLLDQLLDLEAQPSQSLDDCALWYNLNMRHRELTGQSVVQRPGAYEKEAECDNLEQLIAETKERLENFKRLLNGENKQLEFVGELANEYLELNYAASNNEQLARELSDLRLAGGKSRVSLEELEQLLEFIRGSDRQLTPDHPFIEPTELAAGSSSSSSALAVAGVGQPVQASYQDELAEIDSVLRLLIDREPILNGDELGHLAELGGVLERKLTDGLVDVSSGRFRSLSGTLDAVRTILMHRLAADEELAQRERELAEQEAAAAQLAAQRRLMAARQAPRRLNNLAVSRQPPMFYQQGATSAATTSTLANGLGGHLGSAAAVASSSVAANPTYDSQLPISSMSGASAIAGVAAGTGASALPNRVPVQGNRPQHQHDRSRIDNLRKRRRFGDQLAQQQRVSS